MGILYEILRLKKIIRKKIGQCEIIVTKYTIAFMEVILLKWVIRPNS